MRVRSLNAALLALIFSAVAARAEWSVVSNESELSADRRAEHRHLEVNEATTGHHATLELAIFSSKDATLRVLDDPAASSSVAEMMQRNNCAAGVNGGYFDPNYAPVGMLIQDGKVVAPFRKAKLLSGVVSSTTTGRVVIQRAAEFSLKSKPRNARQCGPFLLDRGKPIAGLNADRSARRTFVAVGAERAMLGYCSAVTLAQLAEILSLPELKMQRALNLDGGSSSGFWFKGEQGVFSIRERKTVRDYLGVVAR